LSQFHNGSITTLYNLTLPLGFIFKSQFHNGSITTEKTFISFGSNIEPGLNSTMVRLQPLVAKIEALFGVSVSIPQWFDYNKNLYIFFDTHYNEGLNSTMVRLQLISFSNNLELEHTVSIPQWFDYNKLI